MEIPEFEKKCQGRVIDLENLTFYKSCNGSGGKCRKKIETNKCWNCNLENGPTIDDYRGTLVLQTEEGDIESFTVIRYVIRLVLRGGLWPFFWGPLAVISG